MNFYRYLLVMAVTTYLIRVLPLTLIHKKINNRFLRSFFAYVPTACLSAMTFPAILFTGEHFLSGILVLAVTAALAFFGQKLPVAAAGGAVVLLITEYLLGII